MGTRYEITISATNEYGDGEKSDPYVVSTTSSRQGFVVDFTITADEVDIPLLEQGIQLPGSNATFQVAPTDSFGDVGSIAPQVVHSATGITPTRMPTRSPTLVNLEDGFCNCSWFIVIIAAVMLATLLYFGCKKHPQAVPRPIASSQVEKELAAAVTGYKGGGAQTVDKK